MMKRLLIIAPYFPPIGGSGVYRITRLVKYLREFAWEPVVIACDHLPGSALDHDLLSDLPDNLVIQRVRYIEPSLRGIRELFSPNHSSVSVQSSPTISHTSHFSMIHTCKRLIARGITNMLVPDSFITWIPFAKQAVKNLLRQFPVQAVLSTSTPHTSHIVGAWCARYARIPWMADFRDFWSLSSWHQEHHPLFMALSTRLERRVLRRADHILMYSQGMKNRELAAFPDITPDKIAVLPAAVDLDKFNQAGSEQPWEIVHTGNLTSAYPLNFLYAIRIVNQRRSEQGCAPIKCGVAGECTGDVRDTIRAVNDPDLEMIGYVPHAQAQAMVKSAKVLLLPLPLDNTAWWVPGKVAEYMASGNPIVAIVPPGETTRILKEYGNARIAPDEPMAIAEAIEQALKTKRQAQPSLPELMTARGQAKFVAELANRLVKEI